MKFGVVGISNTVISYCSYAFLTYLGIYYVIANVIGFIFSVTNSFILNNKYVFKSNEKRNLITSFFKTIIAYASTGLVLNNFLLIILVEVFHISEYIAPIFVLIVTIPLNFVINKYWSFRTRKEEGCDETKEN